MGKEKPGKTGPDRISALEAEIAKGGSVTMSQALELKRLKTSQTEEEIHAEHAE